MTERKKIFVFDFDGVVCESTDECMVSSWNAWEKWESRDGFRRTLEEFSLEECNQFRKIRPRVRGAGEYYILRRAFVDNIAIESQEAYDFLEDKWKEFLNPFKEIFFEMRNRLRKQNLERWISLHPIYDQVVSVMKMLHADDRLYIATLKDSESVRLILGNQGLHITEDKILDQSMIQSKLQALDQFRELLICDKSDIIFIDDNITHLMEPKRAGYCVYLTTWGNVLQDYLDLALQYKVPVIDICRLKDLITSH